MLFMKAYQEQIPDGNVRIDPSYLSSMVWDAVCGKSDATLYVGAILPFKIEVNKEIKTTI